MNIGKYEFLGPAARSLRAPATFLRLLFRWIMWGIIGVFSLMFVLGVSGYIVVQTEWFHRWAAGQLTTVLSDQLEARLSFGAVRFNLFRGVELDSVSLTTRGDTVLSARSLRVAYELEPLLIRHIVVRSIILDRPNIRVLRSSADSTWNVAHVFKPKADTTSSPFSWDIAVRAFVLNSARVTVWDSVHNLSRTDRFNATHAFFDSLNLRMSASGNLAANAFALSIDELSAREKVCGLQVSSMHGSVALDSNSVNILHMHVRTPQSSLTLYGSVDDIHVYDANPGIETAPLRLTISNSGLWAGDINLFMPETFSLRDQFNLSTRITGNLTKLRFDVENLQTRQTDLHGSLVLENVANSRPFAYTVDLIPSRAVYSDIATVLPTLSLPKTTVADRIVFGPSHIYGTKDSLGTSIDISGEFGGVKGVIALKFAKQMRYNADVRVTQFDTYAFTNDYSTGSKLNGAIHVQGSGLTMKDAAARVEADLQESSFGGHDLLSASCRASVSNSTVVVDTLDVAFPLSATDSVAFAFDGLSKGLQAHAEIDFRDASLPVANIILNTRHLPLSDLLHDKQMPVSLSVSAQTSFTGFHPDSLFGKFNADVSEFLLSDGALFPFDIQAQIERTDARHRTVSVQSDFLRAQVGGRFRLPTAWFVFLTHLGIMDSYVRTQYRTVQSDTASAPRIQPYTLPDDTLDCRFAMNVKGTAVLAPFIKGIRLDASGDIHGRLAGTPAMYTFDVDTANVKRLNMDIDKDEVFSQPINVSLHLRTSNMTTNPTIDVARIAFRCDSVFRVNRLRFVRPSADIEISGNDARFVVGTRIENHIPFVAAGSVRAVPRAFIMQLDTLYAGWTKSLSFASLHPATISMRPRGVDIDNLDLQLLQSPDRITVNGRVNSTRFDSLHVYMRRVDIATIQRVPELYAVDALQMLKGRIDSLGVMIDGAYARPKFSVGGMLSALRYNNVAIGVQEIRGGYDGVNVTAHSNVRKSAADTTTIMSINIAALPMDLSVQPVAASLRDNENVDITILANDMSLAAVSPFVPGITNLDGHGRASLHIGGTTPDAVDYTGSVEYDHATFTVPATNMRYRSQGKLSLLNTTVRMDSLRIYNEESDLRGGKALVLGSMRIRGFSIRELDIFAEITRNDKFQVMSEATAATSDFMYGRTLISTQDNDANKTLRQLHFHGTPEQPLLNGFIMIEDADVKFPPTINKTTRASTFEYQRSGNKYVWTEPLRKIARSDSAIGDLPAEEPAPQSGSVKLGKSFTDILRTEVDVKIAGNMSVQMDFGFNDQLLAVVRQDNPKDAMRFIRYGSDSTSLRSDLIVDNSSTYKFYETFRASGKMNINGPIDNPQLDLRAMLSNERIVNDRKSFYKVYLNITGTKKKPILKMDYEIDGNDHPGDVGETEITTNAVLLTLFGYTQVELSGSASSATGAVGTKLGASTLGVLLNRVLQGGVIKNVNVDFSGGGTDFSQARIQITAGLYGANVTLGGTVADPTVTLDWALGEFIGANWVTQFMRATNPGSTISRQQKQWEVRVGASIP
ncbi:MAG: hypothetical protein RL156_1836 [Bacteroidota bacterium]